MRNSWRHFFRRIAATTAIAGATSWTAAVCHAQLAFDSADDVAYNDGWQAGDDGGTGSFGPWNFDGTYNTPVQQRIDDGVKSGGVGSSTFNNIGRAWSMFNPVVAGNNRDISRAGRSMGPLQVGQTFRIVFDNPIRRLFFRGYSIKFNTGGGNICYGGGCTTGTTPTLKYKVERFDYFNYGQWYDSTGFFPPDDSGFECPTCLKDTDTDAGARLDFTLTTATTYQTVFTPLDNPSLAKTQTGMLDNLAVTTPIDWIELQFWNSQFDAAADTSMFIKSMSIIGATPPGVPGDYNNNGTVDAADYVLWRNGGPLMNEVADPGTVSPADYTAWRARFGNTAGTISAAGRAVPEPATAVQLVVCAAGLLALGFRAGRQRDKQ